MNDIRKIIRNTLTELENSKKLATPRNYFKEFKKQATKSDFFIEELIIFEELLTLLSTTEKSSQLDNFCDMAKILSKRVKTEDLRRLSRVLEDVLTPSVDHKIDKEIEDFVSSITKDPEKIVEVKTIETLKEISEKRIEADRLILKEKTNDIIKLSSLMGKYFDRTLLESTNSSNEILNIKDELEELNISQASQRELSIVQNKLIDTIYTIENNMEKSRQELDANKAKFEQLHKTIELLQKELSVVKEEKSTDFLTQLLNRRAYHEEVEKFEKKYSIFKKSYAIVFYDLDHFKGINDNYGHTCGDAVLKTFGSILKALTRQEDIITRYGGEEFIALINYTEEAELERYIKRVKNLLAKSKFKYKDVRINIKFSAGVSFRDKYDTYEEAKASADELLYKAKREGRDKVIIDNGIEI